MENWNESEILRYLGCHGQEIGDDLMNLIRECERELDEAATPRCIWREYPLKINDDSIDMSVLRTDSKDLARNLKDCRSVVLFAATLGSGVDLLLNRYSLLKVSRCVVLQAAASAMLETWCDEQNASIRREYEEKGLYLRPRFSPGYGDFSLECQKGISEALQLSKRIGITLTDSLLMVPSKSVTAVIGVSDIRAGCVPEGCEACGRTDCAYRRDPS